MAVHGGGDDNYICDAGDGDDAACCAAACDNPCLPLVFGGAGGQHACAIARSLGISKVFVHKYASVLSAFGLSGAELVEESQSPAATVLVRGGAGQVESECVQKVADVLKEIAAVAGAFFMLVTENQCPIFTFYRSGQAIKARSHGPR